MHLAHQALKLQNAVISFSYQASIMPTLPVW